MNIDSIKGNRANLFDIQRLSLKDGPGIRTGLFFKGCPLRCIWCHNPEGLTPGVQLSYNAQQCVGCMLCAKECGDNVHTFRLKNGFYEHSVDISRCTLCGRCLDVCCYEALSLIGKSYTTDELIERIKPDLPYYSIGKEDGIPGGITLTGGEPMLYHAFILELLQKIPDVHICMETCGFAATEHYLELLPYINLFLFDYKATDPGKHKELCGVENDLILKNLDVLCGHGADIVLRLPLIPGINDDDAHFDGIAALLKKYPAVKAAEVMGYHTLGLSKGEKIGVDAVLTGIGNASDEQRRAWLEKIRERGVSQPVRTG